MPRAKQNMVMMMSGFGIPRPTPSKKGGPACRTKVELIRVSKLAIDVPVTDPIMSGIASAITTK